MRAKKLDVSNEELLDPASPRWAKVDAEVVELEGTPVQLQPSRYIRAKWSDRPTGSVRALTVRPAHNGKQIFFHLEWQDDSEDRGYGDGVFPDAAGVLFPANGDAPLETMGSPEAPVYASYWRADREAPQSVVATGLGTVSERNGTQPAGRAVWDGGRWRVVIGQSLRGGRPDKVAFAVWDGGKGERGGIKSFSKGWRELLFER